MILSDDTLSVTELTAKQWTLDNPFTEFEGVILPLTKSTHNLLPAGEKRHVSKHHQKKQIKLSTKYLGNELSF